MKPYIHSSKSKEVRGTTWEQGGDQLSYTKLKLKEQEEEKNINSEVVKVSVA